MHADMNIGEEGRQSIAPNSTHTTIGIAALILAVLAFGAVIIAYGIGPSRPSEVQTAAVAGALDPFSGLSLLAKAAIVIDIKTGKTLFELNPDVQLPLASLTKVPLALAVAEVLRNDDVVTIPYDTAPAGRLHELYPDSPEQDATLWRMNQLAGSLGLTRTYFLNASGLDISTTQSGAYGSARGMAHLFAYAASAQPSLFAGTARDGMVLTSANGRGHTSAF